MRAHIGLNAQLLAAPGTYRAAGISGYIDGLVGQLPSTAPECRFTAWVPQVLDGWAGVRQRATGLPENRVWRRVFWEQTSLPLQARRSEIDLLHGLAFSVPMLSGIPCVVTILDMSFRLFPSYHPRGRRVYLTLVSRLAAARARAVVAISESAKRDVCRLFGVPEEKVHVTPLGVSRRFAPFSVAEREAFRRQAGMSPYIYYQGTLEPRKQLLCLIEAYRLLRQSGWREHKLVLGGAPGWEHERIYRAVEQGGLGEHVTFLGYVPPDESPRWYAGADLFVYPSAYEGFGLPPLEAMASGTPVVTADASALPEVVGDAGLMVPPGDAAALMQAMLRLLGDAGLRSSCRDAGLARARRFTWAATARQTAAVYSQCLA